MSKVWFITGASSGLGRALAEVALAQGHRVVATARKPEVLRGMVEKYADAARAVTLDVTNLDDVKDSVAKAIAELGRIDVVVNNAGYGLVGAIEEPSDEQIRQLFETNVFGVLHVLRETLPVLRRQKKADTSSTFLRVSALPLSRLTATIRRPSTPYMDCRNRWHRRPRHLGSK